MASGRGARFVEVHHIVPRSDGGNHEAGNLTLLCDGHHAALHEGKLVITGIAPDLTVQFPHVEKASSYARATIAAQAKQVLRTSGFSAAEAKRFVEAALAEHRSLTLEQLIVSALEYSRVST